jgi:hypothetical protein
MIDLYTEIVLASFDAAVQMGIDFYFWPYFVIGGKTQA